VKLLEIFFSKISLKDKWNWHLTQVILYFLELCGISYAFLKLKWHGSKTTHLLKCTLLVHSCNYEKAACTNRLHLKRWVVLMPELFLSLLP